MKIMENLVKWMTNLNLIPSLTKNKNKIGDQQVGTECPCQLLISYDYKV